MAVTQQGINGRTPMGATLNSLGATFRVWAPGASAVYLVIDARTTYTPNPADALVKNPATGHWTGFAAGVVDGTGYRFWVAGPGGSGFKRDPYAHELHYLDGVVSDDYDNSNCIVRDSASYRWTAPDFQPPPFHQLIVYQFHVGVFYARAADGTDRRGSVAKLVDALERVPYLADLGVNAVQPLPFVEFWTSNSLGYNGTDLFSPEMDYCVEPGEMAVRLPRINALLAAKGVAAKTAAELSSNVNQLKLFVDVCHLYGIAVLADVVFNHAGGSFNDQSMLFFDRPANPDRHNDLYFKRNGADWAGGLVFEYAEADVRAFLINNARLFLEEYHMDGLRYDEVRVIDWNGGWLFLQDLTNTVRFVKSNAVQIAEYWGDDRPLATRRPPDGMGFDLGYEDRLRDAVREVLGQAAGGSGAHLPLEKLRDAIYPRAGVADAWRQYHCLENHDLEDSGHSEEHRKPRIAALAGGGNPRSWYATSRARVANGLLLTAPGVPMLFMGQEFLEDKYWSDNPNLSQFFIYWDGLEGGDKKMGDFHRFMRDLCWLRRSFPALTGEGIGVFHIHNDNRVMAFHRWVPGEGRDVVVIASFNEGTFYNRSYQLGFPLPGHWNEVFNSDIYETWVNPTAQGNYGGVTANGPGRDGLAQSAGVTIPANGFLVFAK